MSHQHNWEDEREQAREGYLYVWQRCKECNELRVVTDAPRAKAVEKSSVNDYGYWW